MKYTLTRTGRFKKAFKKCLKRGLDVSRLKTVIEILTETGTLPSVYNPHKLSGDYVECWECHIAPDWLLVWKQDDVQLILLLVDTGSHSDIFG